MKEQIEKVINTLKEVLARLSSGTIDLETAKVVNKAVNSFVKSIKLQQQYNKLRKTKDIPPIDFFADGNWADELPKEQLKMLKSMIVSLKNEIKERKKKNK